MASKKLKLYSVNVTDNRSSKVVLTQRQISRNMDELKKAYYKLFSKSEYRVDVKFIRYIKV